ncbi:MAG: glutathione S-transferase family protein [Alphaproteobacteria bacterium]
MSDIILHQYTDSPFSEKIRVVFGLKDLGWQAVEIPSIMPKPDLMPLTGGYRRTPVMQIGADIYCDTQLIVRELERHFPEPTLHPYGEGLDYALMMWTDRPMFQAGVGLVFSQLPEIDPAFIADREAMTGQKGFMGQLTAAAPHLQEQLRGHLSLVESQLADGRAFLQGDQPSLADVNLYNPVWFLSRGEADPQVGAFAAFPNTLAWRERMVSIGHGNRAEITGEQALDIAKKATSTVTEGVDPAEPKGLRVGQSVVVMPDDYAQDPVAGTLVMSSANEVAIRRSDERVGEVVVHFPRIGFIVQPV